MRGGTFCGCRNRGVKGLAEPAIALWPSEIKEIDLELKRVGSETVLLHNLEEPQSGIAKGGPFLTVLANHVLMLREAGLRAMREREHILEEQLNPERTFPTGPLGWVYVPKQAVFPKKSLFAALGLVIGLLGGMLLSVLRPGSVRKSRAG